jgi:signal transduction histidine kinase
LSIARAVIESHNGTLTLLDRKPRGIIARVTLPRAVATADADAAVVLT